MTFLITLAAITALIYLLNHNQARHPHHPGPRLAGSTDIIDRDTERITAELRTRP